MVRLPLKEKNVDIRFSLKDGGWIKGDRDQVQQILVNLILNALEAVPGNTGKIDFYGEKTLKHGTRYYHLRIEDNGVGLPKDKIAAIFEPFFSEKGKGTGLGLSIVHRLMENHGGLIEAYNLLYGGACFSLYFPIQ
jgi:signal transduction histidine kinase